MNKPNIAEWPRDRLVSELRNYELLDNETIRSICDRLIIIGYSDDEIIDLYPEHIPAKVENEKPTYIKNKSLQKHPKPSSERGRVKNRTIVRGWAFGFILCFSGGFISGFNGKHDGLSILLYGGGILLSLVFVIWAMARLWQTPD